MALKAPENSSTARKTWCGPYALAVLTGLSYEDAYAKMVKAINRDVRRQAREKGLHPDYWVKAAYKGVGLRELRIAAKSMGVRFGWERVDNRSNQGPFKHAGVTLLTFVREHTVKGRTYLVCGGNHYVVVRDGVVYDNSEVGPASIEEYARAKLARLECYAEVRPLTAAITNAEVERRGVKALPAKPRQGELELATVKAV